MKRHRIPHQSFDPDASLPARPEAFMSPEQRADAIAEILCTIGLRSQREKLLPTAAPEE